MKNLRGILEDYMSQIGIKESRMAKVREGLVLFFSALGAYENTVEDNEEVVKNSGIKELLNSNERIKNMEAIFKENGTSIKQVRENIKAEEMSKAPKIKNSIVKTNIQETEKNEDFER